MSNRSMWTRDLIAVFLFLASIILACTSLAWAGAATIVLAGLVLVFWGNSPMRRK
jgi:apolipoprotein N-acyltransferase